MRVDIENGKYTYVSHDSGAEILRLGEFWQDVTGQKVWYCAAYELQEVRAERDALAALCAEAADVLDKTANDTLLGRNMADKLRRKAGGEE